MGRSTRLGGRIPSIPMDSDLWSLPGKAVRFIELPWRAVIGQIFRGGMAARSANAPLPPAVRPPLICGWESAAAPFPDSSADPENPARLEVRLRIHRLLPEDDRALAPRRGPDYCGRSPRPD